MKTVKIIHNNTRTGKVGTLRDLPDAMAQEWIDREYAVEVQPKDVTREKAKGRIAKPVAKSTMTGGSEDESEGQDQDGE